MRLWLDDVRQPPSGDWRWVTTVEEAILYLRTEEVVELSLDYDIHPFDHDGFEVCEWMYEHKVWPDLLHVHSSNRIGSGQMCSLIQQSGYDRPPGKPRSFAKGPTRSRKEFVELSIQNSPKAMEMLRRAEETERAERAKERGDKEPIKLWLDDDLVDRKAPEDWVQVTTAWAAIAWLDTENVVALSLDHDLGDDERFGRGIDVINWLGEQQELHSRPLWPEEGIILHTANAYARDGMARAIRADAGRRFHVVEGRTPGNKPFFQFQSQHE